MKSLNLDGVKFLLKTTYAARRTQTPLFSISKAGTCMFNHAFKLNYYKNYEKTLYVQVVSYKNTYYMLTTKVKKQGYYALSNATNGGFVGKIQGLNALFGKKGLTMRYSLENIETADKTVKAFAMKNVAEDIFVTKEDSNFETVKN